MPSSPMVDLPVDVIDIFSRLPVASLLQFRSISKSWRSLIDSHYFKTLHLNKFGKMNSNLVLRRKTELYAVHLPTPKNLVNLNQPFESNKFLITILASCNGLLCIKSFTNEIAIWNPSLRKHWILPYHDGYRRGFPTQRLCEIGLGAFSFGFGFDSFMGDYKLVKIFYLIRDGRPSELSDVHLFSCRNNAWKTLHNVPYLLHSTMGVFVDHALHWVVNDKLKPGAPILIVAFDLRFEVFSEMPLPKLGEEGFKIEVLHLGGCLSMIVNYQSTRIDLWVMKQYGYQDSWFKQFTTLIMESPELMRSLEFVWPSGYYRDGMKKVLDNLFRYKYNFKRKKLSHLKILRMPKFYKGEIWVESLVQPPFPKEEI